MRFIAMLLPLVLVACEGEDADGDGHADGGTCDCAADLGPLEAEIAALQDRVTELEASQPAFTFRIWEGPGSEVPTPDGQGTMCQLAQLESGESFVGCLYQNAGDLRWNSDAACTTSGDLPAGYVFHAGPCSDPAYRVTIGTPAAGAP